MHSSLMLVILIVIFAVIFDFINGFHDTATAVATSITTRALTPKNAIIICCIFNFLGAFTGTAVAKTVGDNIVSHTVTPQWVIMCVLIVSIVWNILTWYFAIPSSSSHALIGSLLGGGIAYNNSFSVINWYNLFHSVVLWLFLSPVIGFFVGYIIMNTFKVPVWVVFLCALSLALGTSIGGKKIIKTMGSGMTKLTPVNGFAAQTGASLVILCATFFKAPVSTTHIITTTIMGVGASKRLKSVKWGVAKSIVWAWILTIPITAIFSALFIYAVKLFL